MGTERRQQATPQVSGHKLHAAISDTPQLELGLLTAGLVQPGSAGALPLHPTGRQLHEVRLRAIQGSLGNLHAQRVLLRERANTMPARGALQRETTQEVVDRYTNMGGLNLREEALAGRLTGDVRAGHYGFVSEVINTLGSSDRDDVVEEIVQGLAVVELIGMARNSAGSALLQLMSSELHGGMETSGEANKVLLLNAVIGDETSRVSWNRQRVEVLKQGAASDLASLALLFEDEQIVDDGTVQSRLQAVLGITRHLIIPGLQTGVKFGDTGFEQRYKDPHPSSRNQVGHFLTAVGLKYSPAIVSRPILGFGSIRTMVAASPSMSDQEVALRLTVGHEKAPDPNGLVEMFVNVAVAGLSGRDIMREVGYQIQKVISAFRRQFQAATEQDIAAWNEAQGALGNNSKLDMNAAEGPLGRIAIDPSGKGNSRQDLRLSLVGWQLGQLIDRGAFSNRAAVAQWIRANLGPP